MNQIHIARWSDVQGFDDDANPHDSQYKYRILAEGDSWFSIAGFPSSNIAFQMRMDKPAIIVNLAMPGDTIRNMSEISSNNALDKAMTRSHGYRWHAILMSGGGNDLIDNADRIIKKPTGTYTHPADCCDDAELQNTMKHIEEGYQRIVELRDRVGSSCRGKPIIIHTYDFTTPRNSPSRFFGLPALGPWLYRALKDAGVQKKYWNDVSDYLIGTLAERLKGLGKGPNALPAFYVVNTLDTLVPAELGTTRESNDWLNEIHPTADGYRKIARKITRKLKKLLPD